MDCQWLSFSHLTWDVQGSNQGCSACKAHTLLLGSDRSWHKVRPCSRVLDKWYSLCNPLAPWWKPQEVWRIRVGDVEEKIRIFFFSPLSLDLKRKNSNWDTRQEIFFLQEWHVKLSNCVIFRSLSLSHFYVSLWSSTSYFEYKTFLSAYHNPDNFCVLPILPIS